MIPCGIRGKGVTSLARELGHPVRMDEVEGELARQLARHLGCGWRMESSAPSVPEADARNER